MFQYGRISVPLVGLLLLGLFAVIYLLASKRSEQPDPAVSISKHTVDTPADEVLKYWTADKMRGARGKELPNAPVRKKGKKHAHRHEDKSNEA